MPKPTKTLTSITVNGSACQTHYFAGDYFDPTGAVVTAHYSNGTSAVVYAYLWGPQAALTTSDAYASFSYSEGGVTRFADLAITVSPADAPVSLSVSGTPVRQYAGEAFDPYGLSVVAHRHNGGSSQLTPAQCSILVNGVAGGALAASAANAVSFSYSESGVAVSASIQVACSALPAFSPGADAYEWRGQDLSGCVSVPLCDFNPEGYPLSLSLEYQSVRTAAQCALSPELPGGWGLSARAKIVEDCGVLKYMDASGRVLSFSALSGGCAFSLGPGTEVLTALQGGGYEVEAEDGSRSAFLADGRLASVTRYGGDGALALILSYEAGSGRLSEIRYSHAPEARMELSYGASGFLSKVEYRVGQSLVASVSLAYDAQGRPCAVRDDVGGSPVDRTLVSYGHDGEPSSVRDARSGRGVRLSFSLTRVGGLTSEAPRLSSVEEGAEASGSFAVLADRRRCGLRTAGAEVRELVLEHRQLAGAQVRSRSERLVLFGGGGLSHTLPVALGEDYPAGEDLGVAVPGVSGSSALAETFAGSPVLRCAGTPSALVLSAAVPGQGQAPVLAPFREGEDVSVTFALTGHFRVASDRGALILCLTVNGRATRAFLDTRLQGSFQPARLGFRLPLGESDSPSATLSLLDGSGAPVQYDAGDLRIYPGPEESAELGGVPLTTLTRASLPGGEEAVWMTPRDLVRSMRDLASPRTRARVLYACGGSRKFFYPAATPPSFPVAGSSPVPLLSPIEAASEAVSADLSGLSPRTVTLSSSASADFSLDPGRVSRSSTHASTKPGQTVEQTASTSESYDAYLRVVSREEALGADSWETLYEYGRGRLTRAYRPGQGGDLVLLERSYDALGRPVLSSDADRSERTAYGADGRPSARTPRDVDAQGSFSDSWPETALSRDAFGRLIGAAFGGPTSGLAGNSVSYDARGEVSSVRVLGGPGWSALWENYPTAVRSVPLPSGDPSLWEREDLDAGSESHAAQRGSDDYLGASRDGLGRVSVVHYSADDAEKVLLTYRGPTSGQVSYSSAYYGQAVRNAFDAGGGLSSSGREELGETAFAERMPRFGAARFALVDAPAGADYDREPAEIFSPPSGADAVEARCAVAGVELGRFSSFYSRDAYGRLSAVERAEWGPSGKWGEEFAYLSRGQRPSPLPALISVYLGGLQPSYAESVSYDARSRVQSHSVMGVTHNYAYDEFGRLSSWSVWRSGACLRQASYSYDQYGNLEFDGPPLARSQFSYDSVGGRLASVSAGGPGAPVQAAASFSYAPSGKRSSRTSGSATTDYAYFGGRLASVACGSAHVSYPRDERGWPIRRDSSGMGPSARYRWADDGRLVALTRDVEGGTEVLAFFHDSRGPSGFARYVCSAPLEAPLQRTGLVLCHFVRNALGDVVGVCAETQSGAVEVASYVYDPWGLPVESSEDPDYPFLALNPFRYRGCFYDRWAGLYLLGARAYDPATRCFLEPDEARFLDPESPCGALRYAYCRNNPVMYSDPSGHMAVTTIMLLVGLGVGAAIGAATNVVSQYISNGGWDNFSWASFGWNTFIGAASGALAMSTLGAGAMIVANGALGAVGSIGNHLIAGDDFSAWQTWFDVCLSVGAGVLAGWWGRSGAMYGKDFATATSSFARAASSYARVMSKVSIGGYATARGMHIAISRAGNGLLRAMNGLYTLIGDTAKELANALVASAFADMGYAFIGGVAAWGW